MRRAELSLEKHLLPSSDSDIAKHEVELLFSVHDETVEAIRDFYSIKGRAKHHDREDALSRVVYGYKAIRQVMKYGFDNEGKIERIQNHIRTAAVDRLIKVENECALILEGADIQANGVSQ